MTKRQRRQLLKQRRRTMQANYRWRRDWNSIPLADPREFDGVILGNEGAIDHYLVVRR